MSEFKVALKAIIQKDGNILGLKRSAIEDVYAELWDIPGGKIEYGEGIVDGITREIREETGLTVAIEPRPWSVWTFMTPAKQRQTVGVTLLAKYVSGNVKLSNEHTDYRWMPPTDVVNLFKNSGMDPNLLAEIKNFANLRQK